MEAEPTALQSLLGDLQETAWSIARDFTRDWDEAEDLAQDILVETVRSLPTLQQPNRLQPWFATLARRVCLRWKHREQRRIQILGDWRIEEDEKDSPFDSPEKSLHVDELRAELKVALRKISTQSRKALELFYLEELSLRAIAVHLGTSENVVKQRLHWGRHRLKEEMWTMPATSEKRQQAALEPLLSFSSWGTWSGMMSQSAPWVFTRPLLAQQILLQIAKEPKSEPELVDAVGADRMYVADHLSSLVETELVRPVQESRYLADFFILDQEAQRIFGEHKREIGRKDAAIIASHFPEVRAAFDQCQFAGQGFDWEYMRWILATVFLGNRGIRRLLPEIYDIAPPLRPDGNHWYFFATSPDSDQPRWSYGCSTSGDDKGIGAVGGPALHQPVASLLKVDLRPLIFALLQGPRPAAEMVEEGGENARTGIAELIEIGILVRKKDQLHLDIPVFTQTEDEILCPVVENICQEIVDESRKPGLEGLDAQLDRLGYSHLCEQYPAMRASFSSGIQPYCLEGMVEMGLLADGPVEGNRTWGHWAWEGELRLMNTDHR